MKSLLSLFFAALIGLTCFTTPAALAQEAPAQPEEPRLALIEFREIPLEDVLRILSRQTGLQIVASSQARSLPVSLYLENITPTEALNALCHAHGLWMSGTPGRGVVRILTAREFARDAGNFRLATTEVFTLRFPNARDVALTLRDIYGQRVQLARRIDDSQEAGRFESQDLSERFRRFDLLDGRSQTVTTGTGGRGTGTTARDRRLNDRLDTRRVDRTDTRQQAASDEELFTRLSPEQIAALESGSEMEREALLDSVLLDRADIFVTVIDRLNKVIVRTRDSGTMEEIRALINEVDVETSMVLLEVRILRVDLGDGFESTFDFGFESGSGSINFGPAGPVGSGNLVFRYLDDRFRTTIQLLESKNKVTALGRPLLMTANNEVSRLFIGEEVPVNRDFSSGETIITPGGPVVVPGSTQVEFRPVGSTLLITPNINDDRTVTLRLLQEQSQVRRSGADILVPDGAGGFISRAIDIIASQTASGTFVAQDGQTIAIGGLIREETFDRRRQVPILGSIPVVGLPFRRTETNSVREEIVLLMTPHIVPTAAEAERRSRELLEQQMLHPAGFDREGTLDLFSPGDVLDKDSSPFR